MYFIAVGKLEAVTAFAFGFITFPLRESSTPEDANIYYKKTGPGKCQNNNSLVVLAFARRYVSTLYILYTVYIL